MLERDDFLLACRAVRSGLLGDEELWDLVRRLQEAPNGAHLLDLLDRERPELAGNLRGLGAAARDDQTIAYVPAHHASPAPSPSPAAADRGAPPAATPVALAPSPSPAAAGEGWGEGRSEPPTPTAPAATAPSPTAPPSSPSAPLLRAVADRAPSSTWGPGRPASQSRMDDLTLAGGDLPPLRAEGARLADSGSSLIGRSPAGAAGGAGRPRRFGKYEILGELGRGGMGVVYKARELGVGRMVALKALVGSGTPDPERIARFHREVRTAASLRHPAIVPIHDIGQEEGVHYFTMDLIEGRTLDGKIAEGPIPLRDGLDWIRSMADALDFAHKQGVLHRDVKPSNIIVDRSGRPFLTDFGLAKEIDSATQITLSGTVLGTPAYMSPEQAGGEGVVDGRSDVYSLGAVLYEVLTRHRAFDGTSPAMLIYQTLNKDPVAVRKHNPRVHRDVETICEKALQKEPERRYASAAALAEDIGRFLAGEPIQARPPSLAFRGARLARKHRLALGIAVTASAALAATFGYYRVVERGLEDRIASDRRRVEARRRAQDELQSARIASGDVRLAHLDQAVELDPECFEALLLRARGRWYIGKIPESLADADRALLLRPTDLSARLFRFRLLSFALGSPGRALADLADLPAAPPTTALEAAAHGYRALKTGKLDAAALFFAQAKKMDGRIAAGATGLGWCRYGAGDWHGALAEADAALGIDPEDPEAALLRVLLLAPLLRYEEAIAAGRAALGRWPVQHHAAFAVAEACYHLGRYDDALEALEQARRGARLLEGLAAGLGRTPALAIDRAPIDRRADDESARALVAAGRSEEARPLIESAARAGRPLWVLAARVARAAGRADEERRCLEQAAEAGDPAALADLGALLAAAGLRAESEAAFDRALAAAAPPASCGVYLSMAEPEVARLQRDHPDPKPDAGRFLDVERRLHRALHDCPRLAPALVHLATVRLMQGTFPEARAYLDQAVAANPRCLAALLARGAALRDHRELRDFVQAEADLRAAARLAPDRPEPTLELAFLAYRTGKIEEALAAVDAVLARPAAGARALRLRADALGKLDRQTEAATAIETWKNAPPDGDAGAFAFGMGHVFLRAGRYDVACEWMARAIANEPRNSGYYNIRGDVLMKAGNYVEAFRDKGYALRYDPGKDVDLFNHCAETKATQPLLAQLAASAMAQCAKRYPADPCALFPDGMRGVILGKNEAAFAQFTRIVEMDPEFASAHTFRALAALRCGRPEEAAQALERADALSPRNKLVLLFRACLDASTGRLEEAGAALEAVGRLGDVNRRVLEELKELAPLRGDPRYRALVGDR